MELWHAILFALPTFSHNQCVGKFFKVVFHSSFYATVYYVLCDIVRKQLDLNQVVKPKFFFCTVFATFGVFRHCSSLVDNSSCELLLSLLMMLFSIPCLPQNKYVCYPNVGGCLVPPTHAHTVAVFQTSDFLACCFQILINYSKLKNIGTSCLP